MASTLSASNTASVSFYDKAHLWMISFIHYKLYGSFVNPYKLLGAAGISDPQNVLEVGSGSGFFELPAAKMIGPRGHLYSIDINPAAVLQVRKRVEEKGAKNVTVFQADAGTGLRDSSIDACFLFGIVHSLKDLNWVLLEMHRILKPGDILAVQKSSWSEKQILTEFSRNGLFHYQKNSSRIYKFVNELGYCTVPTK